MTEVFLFFLSAFGLIYLVTESVIFAPFRIAIAVRSPFVGELLYCASCSGFWIGAILGGVLQHWTFDAVSIALRLFDVLLCGASVMGAVACMRGFAPTFLPGAWDREREIIDAIRRARGRDAEADPRESSAGDAPAPNDR